MMTKTLQVMNGLKNYTVVTGEGELAALIQREREALKPHECINIDTVTFTEMAGLSSVKAELRYKISVVLTLEVKRLNIETHVQAPRYIDPLSKLLNIDPAHRGDGGKG